MMLWQKCLLGGAFGFLSTPIGQALQWPNWKGIAVAAILGLLVGAIIPTVEADE